MATSAPGLEELRAAWRAPRVPLSNWVRGVDETFRVYGGEVIDAAEALASTVAELEAVLRLALLDDEALELVSEYNPSITTWLLLSELPSEDIPSVLEAAEEIVTAESDFQRMAQANRRVTGAAPVSAVQNLGPELFEIARRKAEAYQLWPDRRHYNALTSFANRRRSGRPLTSRQTAYARGLLREMVEAGVVHVPSPDGDDELCQKIIQAVA